MGQFKLKMLIFQSAWMKQKSPRSLAGLLCVLKGYCVMQITDYADRF